MFDQLVTALYAAVPNPGQGTPPPGGDKVTTVLSWVAWICAAACVVGVLAVGATMAVSHRHGSGGEHAARLGWVLAGIVVIGSASAIVGALI